jgi:hypothetical protein
MRCAEGCRVGSAVPSFERQQFLYTSGEWRYQRGGVAAGSRDPGDGTPRARKDYSTGIEHPSGNEAPGHDLRRGVSRCVSRRAGPAAAAADGTLIREPLRVVKAGAAGERLPADLMHAGKFGWRQYRQPRRRYTHLHFPA